MRPEIERPSDVTPKSDYMILALGFACMIMLLFAQGGYHARTYYGTIRKAADTLKGQAPQSDLAQDIVGFRALVERSDPYPVLGPAMRSIGLDSVIEHASTHPPTAFLLVAPVAYLSWPWAAFAWGWLMLALLYLSFRLMSLRPAVALGLTPLTILWPPVAASLGQLTLVWLFGLLAAYAWARERPFMSGVAIGLAAMTKLFPVLLIVLFLRKRLWRAIPGLAVAGILSLLVLVWLAPSSLSRYAEVNHLNSLEMILRDDNASFLGAAFRDYKELGVGCVLLFLSLVIFAHHNDLASWSEDSLPSLNLWMLGFYLPVALLPIGWVYSVTPILPVIFFLLWQKKQAAQLAGLTALVIPFFASPWGKASVIPLVTVNIVVGLGLILAVLPIRLSFEASFKSLFAEQR